MAGEISTAILRGDGQLFDNTEVKIVTSTLAAELVSEVTSWLKGAVRLK